METKIEKNGNGGYDMTVTNGMKVETGDAMDSYFFWKSAEESANRAMWRIKNENPGVDFNVSLDLLMETPESRALKVKRHLSAKFPNVDVDRLYELFDAEVKKMKLTGPDEDHPNPFMKAPVDSDLVRFLVAAVLDCYVKK